MPSEGFIPLVVEDCRDAPAKPEAMIEVLGGGVTVRVPATADEATLRRVVRVVRKG